MPYENELKKIKSLPQNEVGFAMIKPHFIKKADEVQAVIEKAGLEVFIRRHMRLNEEATDFILREVKKHHFYNDLKKFLMGSDVIILAVKGKGKLTQKILSELKKNANGQDGILRREFSLSAKINPKVKDYWYNNKFTVTAQSEHKDPSTQELLSIFICMNNVVHTADSSDEAFENLIKIFDVP